MRVFALLLFVAACGGSQRPLLANAPHPDNAAVAGGAAAAAAAMTLADPNAATRGKPEKPVEQEEKAPVEVKEHVPADVLDRADKQAAGSKAAPSAKPATAVGHKGPLPKLPTPEQAAEHEEDGK